MFQFSQLYPENRKPNMSSELRTLLSLKSVSIPDIQGMVRKMDNKIILGQDVRNWKKKLSEQGNREESKNVEEVLERLQSEGGVFKYGMNECGEFKFLALMTKEMLHSLTQFPEVLIMDTTYKVNKHNYPLLNILAVDNNGHGRPVFHAFLSSEDSVILSSCLSFFSSSFSSNLTKTIFVDKDMAEICAIRSSLPSIVIRLCAFHTATAVKKALQQRKLPSHQVSCLLDLFADQKSCTDLSKYNALKDKISELSSPEVLSYFNSNWWNCPKLWAASFLDSPTFHITTTNHAETFHQKIKRVLSSKTTLSNCITELLRLTKNMMQSRDAYACIHSMSLKYNTEHKSDIVNEIQNDLTTFAAKIVIEQYLLSRKTNYLFQCSLTCPDTYILSSTTPGSSQYDCTIHLCSCDFFFKLNLPCRHIFALRSHLCLPIYHCNNERFKSSTVTHSFIDSNVHGISHSVLPTLNASTPESRYHITKEITKSIESFFPLLGEHAFQTAISHLNKVFTLIKCDHSLAVIDLSEADIQTLPAMDNLCSGILPTLSEPTSSQSADCLGGSILPTLSESSVSVDCPGVDFSIPASSSAVSTCGFSKVKLSLVKTKGRPRQVQAFTRRLKKRKTFPQDFHSRSCEVKKQMLLSGCLLDSLLLPPHSVSNLKSAENILSIFANNSISLLLIEHLFVQDAWVTLHARIAEKKEKELFSCNSCANRDNGHFKMIECEGCLEWYHYHCVGIRTKSKPNKWFCVDCWG